MNSLFRDKNFYLALTFSILFTYLVDLIFIQAPSITRRELALGAVTFFIVFTLSLFLLKKYLSPTFQKNPHKTALVAGSAIFASLTCYLLGGLIFDWRLYPTRW